jgi:hypothetical protein
MVAVDAMLAAAALDREVAKRRLDRDRAIWRMHHLDGVPGRQIPGKLAEEAKHRGADLTLSYATVRTIIEGPEPI